MRIARYMVVFLVIFAVCLSGCVHISPDIPSCGLWYCEELDLFLDMESYEGQAIISEELVPVYAMIDYGRGIHISMGENQGDDSYDHAPVLDATFVFKDNLFVLTDIHSNCSYSFFEVDKDDFIFSQQDN